MLYYMNTKKRTVRKIRQRSTKSKREIRTRGKGRRVIGKQRRTNKKNARRSNRQSRKKERSMRKRRLSSKRTPLVSYESQKGGIPEFLKRNKVKKELKGAQEATQEQIDSNKDLQQSLDQSQENKMKSLADQYKESRKGELQANQALDTARIKINSNDVKIASLQAATGANVGASAEKMIEEIKRAEEVGQGSLKDTNLKTPEDIRKKRRSRGFLKKMWDKHIKDGRRRKKITKKADCDTQLCQMYAQKLIEGGYYEFLTSSVGPTSEDELLAATVFIGEPEEPDAQKDNIKSRVSSYKRRMVDYVNIITHMDSTPELKDKTFIDGHKSLSEKIRKEREQRSQELQSKEFPDLLSFITEDIGVLKESIDQFVNDTILMVYKDSKPGEGASIDVQVSVQPGETMKVKDSLGNDYGFVIPQGVSVGQTIKVQIPDTNFRKQYLINYILDCENPQLSLTDEYLMKFEELRLKNRANLESLDKDIKDFQRNTKNIERRFYETQEQADERERKRMERAEQRALELEKREDELNQLLLKRAMEKEDRKEVHEMDMDIMKLAKGSSGILGIGKKEGLSADQLQVILTAQNEKQALKVQETLKADIIGIRKNVEDGLEKMELEVYPKLKESMDNLSNQAKERITEESEKTNSKISELERTITTLKSEIDQIKNRNDTVDAISGAVDTSAETPTAEQPAAEQPTEPADTAAEQPATEPTEPATEPTEQAVEEPAAETQAAEEKPTEQAAEEPAAETSAAETQAAEEKPTEPSEAETSAAETPVAEEKPAEDTTGEQSPEVSDDREDQNTKIYESAREEEERFVETIGDQGDKGKINELLKQEKDKIKALKDEIFEYPPEEQKNSKYVEGLKVTIRDTIKETDKKLNTLSKELVELRKKNRKLLSPLSLEWTVD